MVSAKKLNQHLHRLEQRVLSNRYRAFGALFFFKMAVVGLLFGLFIQIVHYYYVACLWIVLVSIAICCSFYPITTLVCGTIAIASILFLRWSAQQQGAYELNEPPRPAPYWILPDHGEEEDSGYWGSS
jgi:hypothetical protein